MIIKLNPAFQSYLWGGNRLKTHFGKQFSGEIIAESWELSCHPDGLSTVAIGEYAGITLPEWIEKNGREVLGENCRRVKAFPILVKIIDAKQALSIQVHPNDEYALKNEGQCGKTEMWYVLHNEPGAFLYHGFARDITKQEYENAVENGCITDYLRKIEVKKGDVFFIEAGTVHAIGAGIVIAEIQQSSNLTYRVFDYGRLDANGQARPLHKAKAVEVSKLTAEKEAPDFGGHIGACEYFITDKVKVSGEYKGFADKTSFRHMLVAEGEGSAKCGEQDISFSIGDSLFIAAGSGEYKIIGECEVLITYIPKR